jgi:LEA14-like dessication related protein
MKRVIFPILSLFLILTGCAGLMNQESLRISVAGLEPLEGKGMEARFAVDLRIQNHSDQPLNYDGVALDLNLRGMRFASGVSDQHGVIPRFGETIIRISVTVPATAVLRHLFDLTASDYVNAPPSVDYQLRGVLGRPGLGGGRHFSAEGQLALPSTELREPRWMPGSR